MLGVDTNVLVRYLVRDDQLQFEKARRLIKREADRSEPVLVSLLVLLETEWVLRSLYRFTPKQIVAALRSFIGLPCVSLQDAALATRALDWCEQGMDFADALHLAASGHCEAFVTFDKDCAKAAGKAGLSVREP